MTTRFRTTRSHFATLTDAELLGSLIGDGLASTLLAHFGSLRALLGAEPRQLQAIQGLGARKIAQLHGALELARRHYRAALDVRPALDGPADTRRFLRAQLRDRPFEVFCCLYLDNRHRVIAFEELFRGTIDGATVYPREVVRQSMLHNAAALIVAHNHPSGIAEPSHADTLITQRLREALALVDIRLLDHLIVAGPATLSLAERGLL